MRVSTIRHASVSGLFWVFIACVATTHAHLRSESLGMTLEQERISSNEKTDDSRQRRTSVHFDPDMRQRLAQRCASVPFPEQATTNVTEYAVGVISEEKENQWDGIDDLVDVHNAEIDISHRRHPAGIDPLCDPEARAQVLSLPGSVQSNILKVLTHVNESVVLITTSSHSRMLFRNFIAHAQKIEKAMRRQAKLQAEQQLKAEVEAKFPTILAVNLDGPSLDACKKVAWRSLACIDALDLLPPAVFSAPV